MAVSQEYASPNITTTSSSRKSENSQSLLRAARAGNLPKLIDAIAIHGIDINTCNAWEYDFRFSIHSSTYLSLERKSW
ncbi:Ankyrin-2 [Taenia solium]|eukprot:TsM_000503200 transcript=TsM_000503200 gene=TsM_000503200